MLSQEEKLILEWIRENPNLSAQKIHDGLSAHYDQDQYGLSVSTLKRRLSNLKDEELVFSGGTGKGTKYNVSPAYEFVYPVDLNTYFASDDREDVRTRFNFELIEKLNEINIFTDAEIKILEELQQKYLDNITQLSNETYKKELDRLSTDLTWKSSQIEGNTYSLLDTIRLLKERKTAEGKELKEAIMLLNHKAAIDYITEDPSIFEILTVPTIENIHAILTEGLDVKKNIRSELVGLEGTSYSPLDNEYQIRESVVSMCKLVNLRKSVFEKAILVMVLISYIQAFMDGNKRTARIVANGILIHHKYCPISFRTVEPADYRKAMLLFYEQNNISAFKQIFIGQFKYAVESYFRVAN